MLRTFIKLIVEEYKGDSSRANEINNIFKKIIRKFDGAAAYKLILSDTDYLLFKLKREKFLNLFSHSYDPVKQMNNDKFKSLALKSIIALYANSKVYYMMNANVFSEYLADTIAINKYDVIISSTERSSGRKALHQIDRNKLKQLLSIAKTHEELAVLLMKIAKQIEV